MIFSDLIDENLTENADFGVLGQVKRRGSYGLKVFEANIDSPQLAEKFNKSQGRYTTINISPTIFSYLAARTYLTNILTEELSLYLKRIKSQPPLVLAVGLGNAFIISDSLGASVVKNLFATHEFLDELPKGIGDLACLIPGVSGLNGIATFDLVKGVVNSLKPDIVLVIDALTAKNYHRLGTSFQISNASLTPGGGVGGKNKPLCAQTLGVPVISLGVPMMISAVNFFDSPQLKDLILSPKEVDIYTNTCAKIIAKAINLSIHGKIFKNFF